MQRLEHSVPPRLAKPITCDIFVSAACSGARTNNEQISHTITIAARSCSEARCVLNPPPLCQKRKRIRYAMLCLSQFDLPSRLAGLCCCWHCVPPCCFNVWGFILTMLEALLLFFYCAAKPPRALNTNKIHKCFLVCQNTVSVSVTCMLAALVALGSGLTEEVVLHNIMRALENYIALMANFGRQQLLQKGQSAWRRTVGRFLSQRCFMRSPSRWLRRVDGRRLNWHGGSCDLVGRRLVRHHCARDSLGNLHRCLVVAVTVVAGH